MGENVRIVLRSLASGLDPVLEVLSPSGATINMSNCDGGPCTPFNPCLQCTVLISLLTLPETGTYTLLVSDGGNNETGGYRVQLTRIPPIIPTPGIPYNVPVNVTISPTTDIDLVSFQGMAGTIVRIAVASGTPGFDPFLEVLDPAGQVVPTTPDSCDGGPCTPFNPCVQCTFQTANFMLPLSGTYHMIFTDIGFDEGGSLTVSLNCIIGPCPNSPSGFSSNTSTLPVSTGGTQMLDLDAGSNHAGQPFIVVGSASGFLPGFPNFLGPGTVPLNMDNYFRFTLANPAFYGAGTLNPSGQGTVNLTLPPNSSPVLIGVSLHHAFVVLGTLPVLVPFVSNPILLTFSA
jgi:hypothetical protein